LRSPTHTLFPSPYHSSGELDERDSHRYSLDDALLEDEVAGPELGCSIDNRRLDQFIRAIKGDDLLNFPVNLS
jgi:hypothetical protein